MSGSEQNTGGSGWAELATSPTTGMASPDPTFLNYEVQYGTYLAAAAAADGAPITIAAAMAMAADKLFGGVSDYFGGAFNDINSELQSLNNVMNAVNLNGQGYAMPDPVGGWGYW